MRLKLLAAALASALALGAAAPANAQHYDGYRHYDHPYGERSGYQLERLRQTLREGVRSGAVNRWEARQLFPELRHLSDLRERYLDTRGMSEREAYDLRQRIRDFRFDVRDAVWDGRGYGQYRERDYGGDNWESDYGWRDRD